MNILAFDTCFGAASVALSWETAHGDRQKCEAYEEMEAGQAERLMPMIAEVMGPSGLRFSDLHRIAVTRGPGAFSGVRVGVAAARSLGLATGVPLVTTTSLKVMAVGADRLLGPRDAPILAVAVDARRGSLYLQLFQSGTCEEVSDAELVSPEEAGLKIAGRHTVAVGSGATMLAHAAKSGVVATLEALQPNAGDLAALAPALSPVRMIVPLYLRPPDAKPQTGASLAPAR